MKPGLRFSLALYLAMVVSGSGMYVYLASQASHVRKAAVTPTHAKPPPPAKLVPGTIFLAQGGALYSLTHGNFKELTPAEGWTQPVALPDGSGLLAVKRSNYYSDLYRLNAAGQPVAQLTHNAAPSRFYDIGVNHWTLYPRLAADGRSIFTSYDSAKTYDYEVDLAVWQIPLDGSRGGWKQWTVPNNYTGGDVQPIPTGSGGLIYAKYDYDDSGKIGSQVWLKPSRTAGAKALTAFADDCSQPALSADGATLAVICSHQQQQSQLELADFNGSGVGPFRVVVGEQLVAQPAFAPDGSGMAFLAPAASNQPFQLWWLPKAGYAAPAPAPSPSPGASPRPAPSPVPPPVPIQVTDDLAFDATSALSWLP